MTMPRKPSVVEKLEAEVRKQMSERFKNFEVIEKSRNGVYRTWLCRDKEPKHSCDCWFNITTIPYILIVTGDIGDLIVERYYDMLVWCRGSVDSTGYFMEKTSREFERTEFSEDKLEEWIADKKEYYRELIDEDIRADESQLDHYRNMIQLLDDTLEDGLCDRHEGYFYEHLHDVYAGDDPPNWQVPTRRFLILREAVRWFVQNYSEPEVIKPEIRS